MRWITFLILLYVMAAFQAGDLAAQIHLNTHWPRVEFLPILAIFYALFAAENAAPFCGLICGLCYDILMPGDLIGTHAVPLAITGFLVMRVRLSIFRERFASQLLISLLALLAYAVLETLMRVIVSAPLDGLSFWTHLGHEATNAVYSTIFAPFIYWLIFRFYPLLGFTSHGPRSRIHESRR